MNDFPRQPIIRATGLVKHYEQGRVRAVNDIDFEVLGGEFVAICGPSGCGKTTLLNLLAAVDLPDAGNLFVGGKLLRDLTTEQIDHFRRCEVGLVFQLHNLLPDLTALENVQVPMFSTTRSPSQRAARAGALLARVGLTERAHALPPELSGGERQRVAVARALANEPRLLLADEPTGSLDSQSGEQLLGLLEQLRKEHEMTLVVVTHDAQVARRADRVFHMLDGRIDNPA